LHACENKLNRVGDHSSNESSGEGGSEKGVHTCVSARIRVDPIIEIEETPDTSSCVGKGSDGPSVDSSEHAADSASSPVDLIKNVVGMETTFKTNTRKRSSFLKQL